MQVDVQQLETRIRALVAEARKKPDASKVAPVPQKKAKAPQFTWGLTKFIESEILRADIIDKGTKITHGCEDCLQHAKIKKAKVLGRGAFGTVFDLGKNALKVEKVGRYDLDGTLAAGKVAARMGELGVGPKVAHWRVCECRFATYLVIEMAKIKGTTVQDLLRKKWAPAKKAKTLQLLREKVIKMNKAGVVHSDMHWGNVMVDKKGVPWIIDFGIVEREHPSGNLAQVDGLIKNDKPNPGFRWRMDGPLSGLALEIFDKLVEEKTVTVQNEGFVVEVVTGYGAFEE